LKFMHLNRTKSGQWRQSRLRIMRVDVVMAVAESHEPADGLVGVDYDAEMTNDPALRGVPHMAWIRSTCQFEKDWDSHEQLRRNVMTPWNACSLQKRS
jgi:hypothetical protein